MNGQISQEERERKLRDFITAANLRLTQARELVAFDQPTEAIKALTKAVQELILALMASEDGLSNLVPSIPPFSAGPVPSPPRMTREQFELFCGFLAASTQPEKSVLLDWVNEEAVRQGFNLAWRDAWEKLTKP